MITRGYVQTPEGQVHYRTAGKGSNLLLLHQTAFSSDEYSDMMPYLEKKFRVVAMDTLGYGMSDKPPQGFTVEDYGKNIIHFLDALKIKTTHVAGHHTGSTLAGEIAAKYPERIGCLIMSGTSLYTPEERVEFIKNPMFHPLAIIEDGSFLVEPWHQLRQVYGKLPAESVYRMVVANFEAGYRLHDAHFAAFRYEKEPQLPKIKSPTLIVCGEDDMFVPKMEAVHKLISRSKTLIIRGGGNALAWQRPQEFAQAIIDFVAHPDV